MGDRRKGPAKAGTWRHIPDARSASADRAFLVAALIAAVTILLLGRGLTFSTFGDEWTFIQTRSLADVSTWWTAHNEHWITAFVIVFRAVFEVVGFQSYLPYLAIHVLLHAVVAGGVYRLARGETIPWLAFVLSVPLLLLGTGWENLFIFFQASILMAVAAGSWALVALREHPNPRGWSVAAILLLVAVMSGSAGLLFLVAATIEALAARRPRQLLAVLPATLAYAAWFALEGPIPIVGLDNSVSIETLFSIATFVGLEIVSSVGAVLGGGPLVGVIGSAGLLVAFAWIAATNARWLIRPSIIGPAAALVTGFVLVAVGRRHLGADAASYGRYLYTSAALLLPLFAALIGRPSLHISGRARRWAIVTCGLILELSVAGNVMKLLHGLEQTQLRSDTLRAVVGAELGELREQMQLSPTRSVFYVPPLSCLEALVARFGDPTTDAWLPAVVPEPDDGIRTEARMALLGMDSTLPVVDVPCSAPNLAGLR